MGGGFALINELTVIQTTQGLLRYIQTSFKDKKEPLSVVIGFDARHQSHQFARLIAALFAHEKFHVYLFDSITVPTPLLAFSVQKLQCQAGIMITASHNPKEDNGYKVYWANGAQIISPIDVEIAKSIDVNLEPWKDKAWQLDILDKNKSKLVSDPIDKVRLRISFCLFNLYFFLQDFRSLHIGIVEIVLFSGSERNSTVKICLHAGTRSWSTVCRTSFCCF
jgi:phosphoglucomutase/phosphopentomutase